MTVKHAEPLDQVELDALEYLRALWPTRWKQKLQQAWETGDYSGGMESFSQTLQFLRNSRGPSWLYGFKFPKKGQ